MLMTNTEYALTWVAIILTVCALIYSLSVLP